MRPSPHLLAFAVTTTSTDHDRQTTMEASCCSEHVESVRRHSFAQPCRSALISCGGFLRKKRLSQSQETFKRSYFVQHKDFFPESWNPSGKRCDLTQVGPDDQHERNFVRTHWRRGIPYPRTGSSQSFARLYSTYIISHFPAAVQALNTKIYHEDPMTWCEGYFFPEHNLLS